MREIGRDLQRKRIDGMNIEASKAELLVRKLWSHALRGDFRAAKLIVERLEGLPTAHVELEDLTVRIAPAPRPKENGGDETQ